MLGAILLGAQILLASSLKRWQARQIELSRRLRRSVRLVYFRERTVCRETVVPPAEIVNKRENKSSDSFPDSAVILIRMPIAGVSAGFWSLAESRQVGPRLELATPNCICSTCIVRETFTNSRISPLIAAVVATSQPPTFLTYTSFRMTSHAINGQCHFSRAKPPPPRPLGFSPA